MKFTINGLVSGPMFRRYSGYFLAVLLPLLHVGVLSAAEDCSAPSDDCVAVGGWNFSLGLGVGVRTNPLVHAQDIPLVVIPQFSYYGKHVFIDDLDLGVTLADGDAGTLNIIASPGYDRVFFYRSDLQNIFIGGLTGSTGGQFANGPPTRDPQRVVVFPSRPRHITYFAGPEWTFKYHGVFGQLDVLHEITAQNRGDEVRAALGIPLLQLAGTWTANIGITWKSAAIVNYYYGGAGIYEGGAALNPFVKLGYSRPLRGRWKLTAFVEYERLGSAIANSPIVADHHVTTAFFGATYGFTR